MQVTDAQQCQHQHHQCQEHEEHMDPSSALAVKNVLSDDRCCVHGAPATTTSTTTTAIEATEVSSSTQMMDEASPEALQAMPTSELQFLLAQLVGEHDGDVIDTMAVVSELRRRVESNSPSCPDSNTGDAALH